MRATTETLSQMTNLLAVVSAPSMNAATVRHVEVLALQPQVVLVVIITSAGNVSKLLRRSTALSTREWWRGRAST